MIDQIIDFNKDFVARKGYEKYLTDKYPDKKLAVLSCMDTRLTELLPAALGLIFPFVFIALLLCSCRNNQAGVAQSSDVQTEDTLRCITKKMAYDGEGSEP